MQFFETAQLKFLFEKNVRKNIISLAILLDDRRQATFFLIFYSLMQQSTNEIYRLYEELYNNIYNNIQGKTNFNNLRKQRTNSLRIVNSRSSRHAAHHRMRIVHVNRTLTTALQLIIPISSTYRSDKSCLTQVLQFV